MARKRTKKGACLYRYTMDVGRMGTVVGTFTATPEEVAAAIGKRVYFGEILGKHSEIVGDLSADEFKMLTDDAAFVAMFDKLGCASGHNPLDVLADNEADAAAEEVPRG